MCNLLSQLFHVTHGLKHCLRLRLMIIGLSVVIVGCKNDQTSSVGKTETTATNNSNSISEPKAELTTKAPSTPTATVSNGDSTNAPYFENVASNFGIESIYRNDEEAGEASIVESLGGGVAAFDYDNDGYPDLFFTGGGKISDRSLPGLPGKLLQNKQGVQFIDVTQQARTVEHPHFSHGVFASDYDNDGFSDLLVTGYGGLLLWKNQGDGTFEEVHQAAQLTDESWSSSAAWGDFNGDGLLDLYVAHYVNWSWDNHPNCLVPDRSKKEVCSPGDFKGLDDTLYVNRGDGTFENSTATFGLKSGGKGLGVVLHDIDQNGTLDVYVANDTEPNFCYINKDGKFVEQAHRMGVAIDDDGIPNGSMGVDLCDYNRDGRPDLWAANYERESFALYRNEGAGFFLHVSRASGITALGGLFVGFGTSFTDVNGDGWEDIVVSNGHVIKYPMHASRKQKPLLLWNNRGKFTRQKFEAPNYFALDHEGRGLALCDFNVDGHPDIVISNLNEPAALLKHAENTFQNFLVLQLIGTTSCRDPVGATATLVTNEQPIVRYRKGGSSYLSTSEAKLFFAWPNDLKPTKLLIRWPSGTEQEIDAQTFTPWMTIIEPNP
jgi:hypothetical protein